MVIISCPTLLSSDPLFNAWCFLFFWSPEQKKYTNLVLVCVCVHKRMCFCVCVCVLRIEQVGLRNRVVKEMVPAK